MHKQTILTFFLLILCASFVFAEVAEQNSSDVPDKAEIDSPDDGMHEESLLPKDADPTSSSENEGAKDNSSVFHLTEEDFASNVSDGDWFIYFGVSWCKYCKKY